MAGELWLLYRDGDYAVNRDYAVMMREKGQALGLDIRPVCLSRVLLTTDCEGRAGCLLDGAEAFPRAVLSRQRDAFVSAHFERMGVPVFNNSRVCALCNDKRETHRFLSGLPQMPAVFYDGTSLAEPPVQGYPLAVKPARGHGGDRVRRVCTPCEWRDAAAEILPEPVLSQKIASEAGRDLRIYVLFGKILTGVMRTAPDGFLSNYKKGGSVCLHEPSAEERELAGAVIRRFEEAGAPLCMAGIDLLYHEGRPVIGEVEDAVGSRMLYAVSGYDLAGLYLRGIAERL